MYACKYLGQKAVVCVSEREKESVRESVRERGEREIVFWFQEVSFVPPRELYPLSAVVLCARRRHTLEHLTLPSFLLLLSLSLSPLSLTHSLTLSFSLPLSISSSKHGVTSLIVVSATLGNNFQIGGEKSASVTVVSYSQIGAREREREREGERERERERERDSGNNIACTSGKKFLCPNYKTESSNFLNIPRKLSELPLHNRIF
eukprot:sb/3470459/